MISALNVATQGLLAGPFSISIQGFYSPVIVIPPTDPIIPPVFSGGSTGSGSVAAGYVYYPYVRKKHIVVTVTINGQDWEEIREVTEEDYSNIDLSTHFIGKKGFTPQAKFLRHLINNDNITIRVKKL